MNFDVTYDHITLAQQRISSHVLLTPLLESERIRQNSGLNLRFKAENLQHIGAFKARGATNAVLGLDDRSAARGVVTHSSGNHAAALARAAKIRGVQAHIVMPHNSAQSKIQSVRWFGFEPIFCEPSAPARAAAATRLQEETGAVMIHPYDHREVIAGQGTVGLEIVQQWPEVDTVLAPVGGGGLMAGLLIALKSLKPSIKVIAVEPELADDAYRSLRSGKIEQPTRYDTIADGLRTCLGELNFPIIKNLVDDLVLVSEAEILQCTRMLCEQLRVVVEPSGAVSVAGALQLANQLSGRNVCCVLSGGNIDFGQCRLGMAS